MDIVTSNQLRVDDEIKFDSSISIEVDNYVKNYQKVADGTSEVLDYGAIVTPSYIKLKSSKSVTVTIGALSLSNVTTFELGSDIDIMTITNNSGEEAEIEFLVAK